VTGARRPVASGAPVGTSPRVLARRKGFLSSGKGPGHDPLLSTDEFGPPVLCAVAALSGCTVPIVGVDGIGVDQDGRPVGYLAVCDEHIDGATLYFQDPDVAPTSVVNETDAGTWAADAPITSSAAWSLAEPQDGWAATAPLADLQADREDHLYGWTQDNTSSTAEVTFTVATLGAMTPGEVFYFSGYEENPDRDVYTTGSVADFQAYACS